MSRRRNSSIVQPVSRQHPLSPPESDSSTPGQGRGEESDLREASEEALAPDVESREFKQEPAYFWNDSTNTMNDRWLDPFCYGAASSLGTTYSDPASASFISPVDTLNPGGNVDDLFDFAASSSEHYPWMEFVAGGEMSYADPVANRIATGTGTDAYDTTQCHDSSTQTNSVAMEDPRRKVSLVVDECDGNTLDYLRNVIKPLKGKVRLEVNL